MAKLRSVNTHFWQDSYIADCTPDEKLVFLYLITCPLCNLAGVYEVTYRQIAFDTGLKTSEVSNIMGKFEKARKVLYLNGFVMLINYAKNQKMNPSMIQARNTILKALPKVVHESFIQAQQVADSVTQDATPPPEPKPEKQAKPLGEREAEFHASVFTMEHAQQYGKPMLQAFYQYWCEPNRSGTKMRMELQPTWKLAGRLATWASRDVKGKPQGGSTGRIYREP